jgi:hypothetical protein
MARAAPIRGVAIKAINTNAKQPITLEAQIIEGSANGVPSTGRLVAQTEAYTPPFAPSKALVYPGRTLLLPRPVVLRPRHTYFVVVRATAAAGTGTGAGAVLLAATSRITNPVTAFGVLATPRSLTMTGMPLAWSNQIAASREPCAHWRAVHAGRTWATNATMTLTFTLELQMPYPVDTSAAFSCPGISSGTQLVLDREMARAHG